MSFPYKAIFVDLDGTLLNSKKCISQKNLSCLNYFIQMGVHVVIATGRTIKSVRNVLPELNNLETPVITLNGSEVHSKLDGYSMSISYLDNEIRDVIFNFCKSAVTQFKVKNILVDTGNTFYVWNLHELDSNEFMHHYDDKPKLLDLKYPLTEQVVSFLFLLEDESRAEFILAQKNNLPPETKVCTFNGWPWIEIGSPKTNKGAAMEFVCEHLGIRCEDVIAFGDGENDVEMLKLAGLGVAMANADTHALEASQAKTLTHDEDGVAFFLEQLIELRAG